MGAITPKHEDLATINASINALGAVAVFQYAGTPYDGYLGYLSQDGRYVILTDPTAVKVGDLVLAGNVTGVVTVKAAKAITIKFDTRAIQEFGVDPSKREIVYNFDTVDANDAKDNKYPNQNSLLGAGLTFLRNIYAVSGTDSSLAVDANSGTADSTDEVLVTVTVKSASGNVIKDADVFITSDGNAVVSAVTNVGDGTYTATVVNGTAETATVSATANGIAVGAPDTEAIVWS